MQEKKPFVDVRVAGEKERGRERHRETKRERDTHTQRTPDRGIDTV